MSAGLTQSTAAQPIEAEHTAPGRPAVPWTAISWFALALAGQTASLQLVDAGTGLHYQHYLPPDRLFDQAHLLPLVVLATQAVLVLFGLGSACGDIRAWHGRHFRGWQLLVLGAAFVLTSATLSRELPRYLAELVSATLVQALQLANVVLVVLALPGRRFGAMKWLATDRLVIVGAIWTVLLSAALNWFVYERHPHVPDEVVYVLHAEYLAAGHLTLPSPPVPEAFAVELIHYEVDRWFCPVPPGWPALLAIGAWAGVPWLVNPLFAGVCVLLTFALLRRLYDAPTARLAVLLLCTSPWFIFLAMSFMTHTATLAFALAGAVGVAKARETGQSVWAWLAGAATGVVSLIRPLEGVIIAGLLGLWAIGLGGRRLRWTGTVGLIVGTALVGGLVLPYNQALTGSALKFPINAYVDKYYGPGMNDLGFGPNRGLGWALDPYPGHGLRDAVVNANLNLTSTNIELFGWGIGSLLLVAVLLVKGPIRAGDRLMLAVVIAVVGAHTFYWFSGGPDFGARYWFLIIVPCVALTASGVQAIGLTDGRAAIGLIVLCVASLVCFFPWRAADKYYHYRGMRAEIRALAREHNFGRSLVLVRGERMPDYASAVVWNPVDLHAPAPIFAWDRGAEVRKKLLEAYPDRTVWVLDGPSRTGDGFRIAAGPLAPAAARVACEADLR
jgi:hypothetical protein